MAFAYLSKSIPTIAVACIASLPSVIVAVVLIIGKSLVSINSSLTVTDTPNLNRKGVVAAIMSAA